MRTKWVLIGFGILYLVVALSFVPVDRFATPEIAEIWSIFPGLIWATTTVVSIAALKLLAPATRLIAPVAGLSPLLTEEIFLVLICIIFAGFSVFRLVRTDLTPGRRGTYVFLLLLSVSLAAMVRFTMYSWSNFG
jgi:hypothetical protein